MADKKGSETPDEARMTSQDKTEGRQGKKKENSDSGNPDAQGAQQPDKGKEKEKGGAGGTIILGLLIAIAGNAALAIHPMFRGSEDHQIILQYFFSPVGIAVLIVGAIVYIAGRSVKKGSVLSAGRAGLVLGLSLLSMWISLPIGEYLVERDVEKAKAFCMSLVEEGIVAPDSRGNYPASIDDELEGKELPRLLQERFYSGSRSQFMFHVEDPRDDTVQHIYRSEVDRWHP